MDHKLANAIGLFIDGVCDGHLAAALDKYVAEALIQHTPGIGPGRTGLLAAYQPLVDRYDRRLIWPLRGFVDGSAVFLHTVQTFGYRAVERVAMDVFDTDDDDHIVEHWSVPVPLATRSASGYSQIDGPTLVDNDAPTDANRRLVRGYTEEVLIEGRDGRRYVAPDWIDHHPNPAERPTYVDLERVVACGDFVATVGRARLGGRRHRVADLYRVAGGRIVEWWNTATPLETPPEKPPTKTGKRGTGWRTRRSATAAG